ncbi:hypothetical protein ACLK19_06170 [Escherichia coli]
MVAPVKVMRRLQHVAEATAGFVETVNFINKKNSAATCIAILPGALISASPISFTRGDGNKDVSHQAFA